MKAMLVIGGCASVVWPTLLAAQTPPVAIPKPPPPTIEFFTPVHTSHRLRARCAAAGLTLRWAFTENGLQVIGLDFGGSAARPSELAKINGWLGPMPEDVVARVECDNELARITFIEGNAAGTAGAKQVRIIWGAGVAELERTIGIDD